MLTLHRFEFQTLTVGKTGEHIFNGLFRFCVCVEHTETINPFYSSMIIQADVQIITLW